MYTMVLSSFADTERLADQKKEAIALLSQALKILDSLGPSHLAGKHIQGVLASFFASPTSQHWPCDGLRSYDFFPQKTCTQSMQSMSRASKPGNKLSQT